MSSFLTHWLPNIGLLIATFSASCAKETYQPSPIDRRAASGADQVDSSRKSVQDQLPEQQPKVETPPKPEKIDTKPTPAQDVYADLDRGLPSLDLQGPIGGSRPVSVKTPLGFKPQGAQYPLLILLHGYNSDGEAQDRYLGLSRIALDRGYIFVAPNGTSAIAIGTAPGLTTRFWNATESCCNFTNAKVDDVVYLRDLIRQMIARYPVDPKRVYLFGHSNGAFMAHRMACDESLRITAIAALAGSLRAKVADCQPKVPVAVLTIHGTSDPVIQFNGGQTLATTPRYPSALETISHWAKANRCSTSSVNGTGFSILKGSSTAETTPIVYESCAENSTAELWKIDQGGHIPNFDEKFVPRVLDFFAKYKK